MNYFNKKKLIKLKSFKQNQKYKIFSIIKQILMIKIKNNKIMS